MQLKPIISKELVDILKDLYPDKLPTALGVSELQIAYQQGQQSVIQRLQFMLDDDQPDEN